MSRARRDESSAGPHVDARVTTQIPGDGAEEEPRPAGPYERRTPTFDIVILGDLSGRSLGGGSNARTRWVAERATPDNMPDLVGLRPSIALGLGERNDGGTTFAARRLDDFNPDAIFRAHPLFAELREARAAAIEGRDPGFFSGGTSAEEEEAAEASSKPEGPPTRTEGPTPVESEGDLLDRIVEDAGEPEGSAGTTRAADAELRSFVRQIVRPHLVRAAPDRSEEVAALDRAAGEVMRAVLHDPAFRSLEALWRGVGFLLSRIDTTGKVRVYLVDLPRDELERGLSEEEEPARSSLERLLANPASAGGPSRWSLAVGAYDFGSDDLSLLGAIGRCARSAGVPWVSGAEPDLVARWIDEDRREEDTAFGIEWRALREAPEASSLALVTPRFLAREPWGSESARPCRTFPFREEGEEGETQPDGRGSRPLLWGNPAFVAAAALAREFARHGRAFAPERAADLGQVPLAPPDPGARFPRLTETRLVPSDASRLAEAGFTTIVAFPQEVRLRVLGVRPLSSATGRLEAWWTRRE